MARRTALLALALAACAGPGQAQKDIGSPQHRTEAALLGALLTGALGAVALPTPDCANDASGAVTVAADVAFFLAALDGAGRLSAACAPGPPGGEACRVTVGESVPGTERRWSRIYQFLRRGSEAEPATLVCSTVP
jgi:hypothetical protein